MVVRFTWSPEEWRDAHALSRTEEVRHAGIPMTYLLVGLMALGGAGDLANAAARNREAILHDSLSPVLLLIGILATTVLVSLAVVRRRSWYRGLPQLPTGEQQVTLHELGWEAAAANRHSERAAMRGWSEVVGLRSGHKVLALMTQDGSTVGVPLRALSADQGKRLRLLLQRKLPQLA